MGWVVMPAEPSQAPPPRQRAPVRFGYGLERSLRSADLRHRRSGHSPATIRIVIADIGSRPPRLRPEDEIEQSELPALLPPPLHPLLPDDDEPLPEHESPPLDDEELPEHADCSPPDESPEHESPSLDDESPPHAESPSDEDESPPHPLCSSLELDESPPHAELPSDDEDDDESPPHESPEPSLVLLVESPQHDVST